MSVQAGKEHSTPKVTGLIERVVERGNMMRAYEQVMRNKGAAGIDTMTVEKLLPYLQENWAGIKERLLEGEYYPQPVRKVEIPKPDGGVRQLGIPTVLDRLIQQAVHQVLEPVFDPTFSESSYGFRKGRKAQDAILRARQYQEEGKAWVVDLDLAKFFDELNHDLVMARVMRRIDDKPVQKLVRRYLQAGVLDGGLVNPREKGAPQGGPLSPLLSNIMLDDLDKELEKRGHSFCRYADDCNIYVASEKAGQRVMESIIRFVEEDLKLKVNRDKSAVAKPSTRKFLGYSFLRHKEEVRIRISPKSVEKLRGKLKSLFRMGRGRNIGRLITEELNPVLRGWGNYFILTEVTGVIEDLDGWVRRRLRLHMWKQWKRGWTRRRRLMERGLDEPRASKSTFNGRGSWWNSGASHMNEAFPKSYFDHRGLVSMLEKVLEFKRLNPRNRRDTWTVCPVV
jgi:RNA-directed DNA polymerase